MAKGTLAASHSAVDLGKSLFPIFALALNIPENFFDDKVRFLVMFFFAVNGAPADTTFRCLDETAALPPANWSHK